jgi:hypothetical protein
MSEKEWVPTEEEVERTIRVLEIEEPESSDMRTFYRKERMLTAEQIVERAEAKKHGEYEMSAIFDDAGTPPAPEVDPESELKTAAWAFWGSVVGAALIYGGLIWGIVKLVKWIFVR